MIRDVGLTPYIPPRGREGIVEPGGIPMTTHATVLLVDDDVADVDIMCVALARSHAPVRFVCVTHGAEAIAYLSRGGKYADVLQYPMPSLMLLDLAMPAVNGFDVLQWMRTQAPGTMPPVFVLTRSESESDARRARELGASAFITKPMDLEGTVILLESLQDFWTWPIAIREQGITTRVESVSLPTLTPLPPNPTVTGRQLRPPGM